MPQTIDVFRSSTWGWLRGTLAGWGTILLLVAGPVGAVIVSGSETALAPAIPLLLSVTALVTIALHWIGTMATKYEITEDRLILHRGIVNKSIDEIELYRVKDVRIAFSLLNQMADIGTIGIASSDETTRDAPLILPHIPRARARREELRTLVDAARRKRGVREIDMVHEDM
jgi:uncharacterized membrane protein YdbT with pleckstrin-like domain